MSNESRSSIAFAERLLIFEPLCGLATLYLENNTVNGSTYILKDFRSVEVLGSGAISLQNGCASTT